MVNSVQGGSLNKVRGRVLFTGNGELMIDNLMEHIPEKYETMKCPPTDVDFIKVLKSFHPHAVVVCLLDETREMLKMYNVFEEDPKYARLPVLALGREEDCTFFRKKVVVKNMEFFVRPIDTKRFWETLEQYIDSADEYEEEPTEESWGSIVKLEPDEETKESVRKMERLALLHGRKSILVVDDDVRMLNVIKLYLQDLYDITVVPNGKLALKFLSKKSADLVLLDYMMPDLDGPEVLKQIREGSPNPDVPVLFLTGVSDRELVIKGLEFRPNGYLLKPITREALLEKVTEIMLGL